MGLWQEEYPTAIRAWVEDMEIEHDGEWWLVQETGGRLGSYPDGESARAAQKQLNAELLAELKADVEARGYRSDSPLDLRELLDRPDREVG